MKYGKSNMAFNFGGFTLVELLITLAIVSIIAIMAIPAMSRLVRDLRVSGFTNEFIGTLNMARTEAIKRNRLVGVCRTNEPNADAPVCLSGNNWNGGWIVFVNANMSGKATIEEVIARHDELPDGINLNSSNNRAAMYNSTGRPIGSFVGSTFTFDYKGSCCRKVIVSRSGRVRVESEGTPCTGS